MTLPVLPGVAYARANRGRWIVDCPAQYCGSALQLRPGDGFRCWECETGADVVWPADPAAIEAALMLRPDWRTRNWVPGESVMDLLLENLAHGVPIVTHPELGASASRFVVDLYGQAHLLDKVAIVDSAPQMLGA